MQSSIFDIFGEDLPPRRENCRKSATSHILKGPGIENLRAKSAIVADHPSKTALGDIGNSQKKSKALHEKIKLINDQENASANLLMKTPLHKSKMSLRTPNIKPVIRSPLSDLLPKSRSVVQISQQPKQTMKTTNSKFEKIEDFLNGGVNDLSCWEPEGFFPEDDYTDILPKSVQRSDAEIYRLVNYWEMSNKNVDFESDEDVAIPDNSDCSYMPQYCSDTVLEEPFSVPVFSDDDL